MLKIAYCGIDCNKCPAFIATVENDDQKRKETSVMWSKMFNVNIDPKEINCNGCQTDGALFSHCKVCEIRKCGMDKGTENCGKCKEFDGCSKIQDFIKMVPDAKQNLGK